MPLPSVAVVGGGVIGRTAALLLAQAGHAVTLITAEPPLATTSAKAGAVWMPFLAYPIERVNDWSARAYRRLFPLAADTARTGVQLVEGRVYYPEDEPELGWLAAVAGARIERPGPGDPTTAKHVAVATVPCVDMSRFLPWLQTEGAAAGVIEIERRITSVDEAREHGELVVLATGLGTNDLVPDAGLYPIQGQVVRIANPGGVGWLADNGGAPGTDTYVIPRVDEIVLGGTDVPGAASLEPDPVVEAAIRDRVRPLIGALADAPATSRAVGLRPGRAEVRLERIGDVVHCYGHGGSGVTMAFGCAEDVVALCAG